MGAEEKVRMGVPRARYLTMSSPPTKSEFAEWLQGLGTGQAHPVFVVEGPTVAHRELVYAWGLPRDGRDARRWITSGVQEYFVDELSQLGSDWGVLWNLLDVEEFFVDEPLRSLVDQGLLFTEFYQTLWETRFLLQESAPDVERLVDSVVRWLTGQELSADHRQALARVRISREVQSPSEQLDLLLFLVALARQNAALSRPLCMVFDDLDVALGQSPPKRQQLLGDLLRFVEATERWNRLGAPLGVMVGVTDHATTRRLQSYSPKLHAKLL